MLALALVAGLLLVMSLTAYADDESLLTTITATVTPAEGYIITKCIFYDDQNRTATDSEAPFVVETTEDDKTPQVNGTPILANQSKGITKIEVYGYAASDNSSNYTITIPEALIVQNIGWNELPGGITAS